MTLIEKFLPQMYCFFGSGMLTNTYDERIAEQNAKECEKIADGYAIEFAEWCGVPVVDASVKELLEIFKKEKGL
jgi:hypothetical protein